MQQPQPASGPAAQPQQSQQPQQFQQPASHTQQWAPVIEAHDLVMDYTASMARAQAGHGVTGVMPAGTGAGYASANPAAAGPGAIQAGQPSQPAQPGFAMPTMHTLALNHVNFTLREGETVAVMGPSGSGKSTLLHALAGIIKPTAGTVIFRGADLSRMSDAERTKLRRNDFGFVFQSGQLLPELPAVENIALPMMLDGMPYRTATDTAILWLERMGLRALATHRPRGHGHSHGRRAGQRFRRGRRHPRPQRRFVLRPYRNDAGRPSAPDRRQPQLRPRWRGLSAAG